ncbi:hypothetical protein LCGC14_1639920, partial [marine sediment metagenome]
MCPRKHESDGPTLGPKLTRHAAHLAEECRARRLVVFAGAGVSVSCGLPGWQELIQGLLSEAGIETRVT